MAQDIHYTCKKQKAFAWAKYYEAMATRAENTRVVLQQAGIPLTGQAQTECPPHIVKEFWEMANELRKEFSCPVCFDVVGKDTIKITMCGHIYCSTCLDALTTQATPKCAICRKALPKKN